MRFLVLAHGGTGSDPEKDTEGAQAAADRALEALRRGAALLDAVVDACVVMEDDPRFNAGTGSNLMFDGAAIEMDAACMSSDGRFGAVCALREVKNPVRVAKDVLFTPHNVLAGKGALLFARVMGHAHHNPWTPKAQKKYEKLRDAVASCKYGRSECEWEIEPLEKNWNYPLPMRATLKIDDGARGDGERVDVGDTIGAVATDGMHYAAAASTGGTVTTLLGRIGDTPMYGAGVYAGPRGAIACSGNGDHITRKLLAYRIHGWLEEGLAPDEAAKKAKALFDDDIDVCFVVVSGDRWAADGNRTFAWAKAQG